VDLKNAAARVLLLFKLDYIDVKVRAISQTSFCDTFTHPQSNVVCTACLDMLR